MPFDLIMNNDVAMKDIMEELKKFLVASDEDLARLNELIGDFVASYYQCPEGQNSSNWLKDEFIRYSTTWCSEDERMQDYNQIIDYSKDITATFNDYRQHVVNGESDSWLVERIERGAQSLGRDTGKHAQRLKEAFSKANKGFVEELDFILPKRRTLPLDLMVVPIRDDYYFRGCPVEWSESTRISVVQIIKRLSVNNVCGNIVTKGRGMLAKRHRNTVMDRDQRVFGNLGDFCKMAQNEAINAGIGIAVSGALTVFSRSSNSTVLRAVPGRFLACLAFDTLDKIRILYQAADTNMDPMKVIEAAAISSCITAVTFVERDLCTTIEVADGAVFDPLDILFHPVGAAIGAFTCSAVDSIVGSTIAKRLYEECRDVCKAAGQLVELSFKYDKDLWIQAHMRGDASKIKKVYTLP